MAEGGERKDDITVKEQLLLSTRQTLDMREKPKYPDYADFNKRLSTYDTWKADPELKNILALNGQIYTGVNCTTKCYCCDGGHKNWKAGDDPAKIHAEEYPECELIQQLRDVNIREDNHPIAEAVNEACDKRDTSTATDDESGNREPPQIGTQTSDEQMLENPPGTGQITAATDIPGSATLAGTNPDTRTSGAIPKRVKTTNHDGMPATKRTKFRHTEAVQACLDNGCTEVEVDNANEEFKQDNAVTREPSATDLYKIVQRMRDEAGDPATQEKETMTDPFTCTKCLEDMGMPGKL